MAFALLPLLPPEIQLQVWDAALATPPRTIQLQPWTCERWRRWNTGCTNRRHAHDATTDQGSHRAAFVLWGYLETPFGPDTCGVGPAESVPTCDALAATCYDARRAVLKRFPSTMSVFAAASRRGPDRFVRRTLRFDPATDIFVFRHWRGFSLPAPTFDPLRDLGGTPITQHLDDDSSRQFAEAIKAVQNVAIPARTCDCGRRVRATRFWRHMCGIEEQMGRLHHLDSLKRVYICSAEVLAGCGPQQHLSVSETSLHLARRELSARHEAACEAIPTSSVGQIGDVDPSCGEPVSPNFRDAVVMAGVVRRRFAESDLAWLKANGWARQQRTVPDVAVWVTPGEAMDVDKRIAGLPEKGSETAAEGGVGSEPWSESESDVDGDDT